MFSLIYPGHNRQETHKCLRLPLRDYVTDTLRQSKSCQLLQIYEKLPFEKAVNRCMMVTLTAGPGHRDCRYSMDHEWSVIIRKSLRCTVTVYVTACDLDLNFSFAEVLKIASHVRFSVKM